MTSSCQSAAGGEERKTGQCGPWAASIFVWACPSSTNNIEPFNSAPPHLGRRTGECSALWGKRIFKVVMDWTL